MERGLEESAIRFQLRRAVRWLGYYLFGVNARYRNFSSTYLRKNYVRVVFVYLIDAFFAVYWLQLFCFACHHWLCTRVLSSRRMFRFCWLDTWQVMFWTVSISLLILFLQTPYGFCLPLVFRISFVYPATWVLRFRVCVTVTRISDILVIAARCQSLLCMLAGVSFRCLPGCDCADHKPATGHWQSCLCVDQSA